MSSATNSPVRCRSSSHDLLWWCLLLPELVIVLFLGLYVVLFQTDQFPYVVGVAAFSIAFALHFFTVPLLCSLNR